MIKNLRFPPALPGKEQIEGYFEVACYLKLIAITEEYKRVKLELLTIISKILQIVSSFILIAAVIAFVSIKIKNKNNKSIINFSNPLEGVNNMSEQNSNSVENKSTDQKAEGNSSSNTKEKPLGGAKKMKVYAVYNPDENPNFYLHNRLNWYKNFD